MGEGIDVEEGTEGRDEEGVERKKSERIEVKKPQAKRARRVTRRKSTVTQGEAYGQPPYDQGEEEEGGK